jgi:hypothetical protein
MALLGLIARGKLHGLVIRKHAPSLIAARNHMIKGKAPANSTLGLRAMIHAYTVVI